MDQIEYRVFSEGQIEAVEGCTEFLIRQLQWAFALPMSEVSVG